MGYEQELSDSLKVVKSLCKSKSAFDDETTMLDIMKTRYDMCYAQIHGELAPLKTKRSESQIIDLVKDILSVDLRVCESKISRFRIGLESYTKKGDDEQVELIYRYLQEWLMLYEGFYALVAFRHLEFFSLFMEWDKRDSEKVWLPSLDPYGDGGYTGVSKPFFFYFNQMVLKKDIKFISKQMFTGGGKCIKQNTKIMTPTGNRMIKDINVGDFVYSMKDNELCERRVLNKWNTRKKQIKITTRGGVSVITSPEHRLYTQRGYVQARDIKQSDYLYRLCKKYEPKNPVVVKDDELVFVWEQIKSIEFDDTEVDMVDIEVEETHNFIANHIVSHNSYSNQFAIAWVLGIDHDNDVLDVLGNPTLVLNNSKGIVEIMTNPRFAKVFPEFQKYFDMEGDIKGNMFSVCRMKEGELTLECSKKPLNVKIISKQTSIDGIRVRYLFLDDVCRSIDANNLKQHQIDIDNFWNSWWKRNYGTDDFYIVACGTAYSVNDILSHLIAYYSKGKMKRTKINKYTYESMDGSCIFIKIPKIDDDFNRSTYPQKFPYDEAIRIKERNLASFLAMEQQQPQNPETSPLCYEKLNTYERLPDNISENAYACLDPARTGKNYVTMGIHRTAKEKDKYGVEIERHYLVDCIFQLKQMEDIYGEICDKILHHHIIRLHVENNTDTSLRFLLEKMLHERGIMFCEISESFSSENKEEKMREMVYGMEGYFKNQMVYPAMSMYAPSSQMGKFMLYFTSYDYYKPVEYDDSIDEECMYIDAFVAKRKQLAKAKLLHL